MVARLLPLSRTGNLSRPVAPHRAGGPSADPGSHGRAPVA